jgi:hypothetical protein
MIIEADPIKLQNAVKEGFGRLRNYRKRRAAFVKEYCGRYFKEAGAGNAPINLLFSTIRALVPNLVMKNGINDVTTEIIEHKMTAELLSHGLNTLHEEIKLKDDLRAMIVDAIFAIGILEVGLATSDNLIGIEEDIWVDPGRVFHQTIDLDDFVIDPMCTSLREAFFMGHLVTTPRQSLYEVEGLDKGLIDRLPKISKEGGEAEKDKGVEMLSKERMHHEVQDMEDIVEVLKLYIPSAHSVIYMPDPRVTKFEDFIGVKKFYGPENGPYHFLSFSQPVPNNPMPVAPVGIWYDLHVMANRIAKKMLDQADSQKDLILYSPQFADTVQDMLDAGNLEAIMCENPSGVATHSLGGANPENIKMLGQLASWYNYIAGNPDQMSGVSSDAETATQAEILQANSNVSINDMRDILYDTAAGVSRSDGWYLFTDPLLELPKTQRSTGGQEVQIWLTPEQIEGDFLEYMFKFRARSMGRLDPMIRTKRIIEFGTNVIPAQVIAAQAAMQMGVKYDLQKALTNIAEELEIADVVMGWFDDPEYKEKLQIMMEFGTQNAGKGQIMSPQGVQQNGGFPMQTNIQSPKQESRGIAQQTAGVSQGARRSNLDMKQRGF